MIILVQNKNSFGIINYCISGGAAPSAGWHSKLLEILKDVKCKHFERDHPQALQSKPIKVTCKFIILIKYTAPLKADL